MKKNLELVEGIFLGKKRRKHSTKKENKKSDEITIDTKKFASGSKDFFEKTEKFASNKYVKYGWIALLIIVLIVISSYTRLGTLNLPITDSWADNMIANNYRGAIEQQIRAENPNLPESSIQRLIDERYASFYDENFDMLESQKQQLSSDYKRLLQNDNGMTYLLGIDEYMFYSYAKWYQRNNHFGTELVDGEPRFMLRNGRFGMAESFRLHPFLINVVHDFLKPFNPDFNIEWASFYIQVILIALAAIPLFFLTKRFSGTTGGFIAAALVLTAIPLIGRTLGGSSDDDAHTILYTFIMMALFVYALNKKTWVVAVLAALTGLTNAIFMFGWSGWWYGFLLVLGSAGLYVLYEFFRNVVFREIKENDLIILGGGVVGFIASLLLLIFSGFLALYFVLLVASIVAALIILIKNIKKIKKVDWINKATFVVVFFVSAIIFAMILSPLTNQSALDRAFMVVESPLNPLQLVLKLGGGADVDVGAGSYPLWPNVLRTVAELNPASFRQITSGPGSLPLGGDAGILFFYLSLAGIITLFFRYKEDSNYPLFGIILLVWMFGMIFIATSAVRFILMASIPILLGVGALIGAITGPVAKYVSREAKFPKSVLVVIFSLLLVAWFLWTPIQDARATSEGAIPIFDDAWYESVYAIKSDAEQYDERGIISSWWDYGHFFQAYGEQSVTFDGGAQGKRIYWMGRTLLTSDVTEAHNILKVMNCGQEEPYNLLEDYMDGRYNPTMLNLAIAQMSKEDARTRLLSEGLPNDLVNEVLSLTHCDDYRPMYFVTSEDMVGKASVWSHFGGWNFTRAYFYYRLKHLPLDEVYLIAEENIPNLSRDRVRDLYAEASGVLNEDQAAAWISPFVNYATRQKISCSNNNDTVTCNFNAILQQDSNQRVVLSRAIVPLDDLNNTQLILQVVNRATNTPLGQETLKPANVVIERDGVFEEYDFESAGLGLSLVLMEEDNSYTSLLTDPSLSKSLFTRLFFMEGRGSDLDMFEKISDVTSFRGERIIVWKVSP